MGEKGKSFYDSLEVAKNKIQLLQAQLNSALIENNHLQNALNPLSVPDKIALLNIKKWDSVRPLKLGNAELGLVLKVDCLKKPLTEIRDHIADLLPEEEESLFALVKGDGSCDEHSFPTKPYITTKVLKSMIEKFDLELGKPGVNVAGLLKVTAKECNVSTLLSKTPSNVIWFNAGDSPLLIKISSKEQRGTMLIYPGYAFVLGQHKTNYSVYISSFSSTMDSLFKSGKDEAQPYAICFTTGAFRKSSWLNALNSVNPEKQLQDIQTDREMSLDPELERPNIRERLQVLGIPLRKRSMIRLAPMKSAELPADFLETKVSLIRDWVKNIKRLNTSVILPDLDEVVPEWETPRNGNPFKIIRVFFKTEKGLETMRDLLHGSKVGLINGLPQELFLVREKIYVSQKRPRGRLFHSRV